MFRSLKLQVTFRCLFKKLTLKSSKKIINKSLHTIIKCILIFTGSKFYISIKFKEFRLKLIKA